MTRHADIKVMRGSAPPEYVQLLNFRLSGLGSFFEKINTDVLMSNKKGIPLIFSAMPF